MPTLERIGGVSYQVGRRRGPLLVARTPAHNVNLIKKIGGQPVSISWPVRNTGGAPGVVRLWVTSPTTGLSRQSQDLTVPASGNFINLTMSISPDQLQLVQGQSARFFAQVYDNTDGQLNTVLSGHQFDVLLLSDSDPGGE